MTISRVARAVTAFIDSAARVAAVNDNALPSAIEEAIARALAEPRADNPRRPGRGPR